MIHYWECLRCPNRWSSCCGGHSGESREALREYVRELSSSLCASCYQELKKSNSREWHLLNEIFAIEYKIESLEHIAGIFGDLTIKVEFELPKTPERLQKELTIHWDLVTLRKKMGLETLGEYPHVIVRYAED